jgi:lysophospholipase L1-like esterase
VSPADGIGRIRTNTDSPDPRVDLDTDLVTITIGGNDAQFGPIINHCVRVADCVDTTAPFDDAAGRKMRDYVPQLIENRVKDAVFAAFEQAMFNAPNATVLVLGYPRLVSGNTFGCEETEFSPIGIPLAYGLSANEQRWIREMGDFLNKRLKQAADLIGVHFEEVVSQFVAGDGHNVCDSDPWISGVVENELVESFHPTIRGHQAYAEVVNDFLAKSNPYGYFESGMPRNPPER